MAIRQLERNCQEYIELGELHECLAFGLSSGLISGVWHGAHFWANVGGTVQDQGMHAFSLEKDYVP